jgi:hypothetical protein
MVTNRASFPALVSAYNSTRPIKSDIFSLTSSISGFASPMLIVTSQNSSCVRHVPGTFLSTNPSRQLEAIKQTNVNMTVYLGIDAVFMDDNTTISTQRDLIKSAIQNYGSQHVAGVTVGRDFMRKYFVPIFLIHIGLQF